MPRSSHCYDSLFPNEETKAQRGEVACPRARNRPLHFFKTLQKSPSKSAVYIGFPWTEFFSLCTLSSLAFTVISNSRNNSLWHVRRAHYSRPRITWAGPQVNSAHPSWAQRIMCGLLWKVSGKDHHFLLELYCSLFNPDVQCTPHPFLLLWPRGSVLGPRVYQARERWPGRSPPKQQCDCIKVGALRHCLWLLTVQL